MNDSKTEAVDIKTCFPHSGRVEWIGLRPARETEMSVVRQVDVSLNEGLIGDRFSGKPGAARQVTLIQSEHLDAVAALMNVDRVDPQLTRRNIVVSGINLVALKGAQFSVGEVILQGTGPCAPCSQMERNLGTGGFNAMRGHGGITARVIKAGTIHIGDPVTFMSADAGDSQ